jgi:uncharacterized protein
MRVVLDTNVLVSAALKQKSMPGMAALRVERRGGMLKSVATEQQLFEVIGRPYFHSLIDPDTQAWLSKLMAAAELVRITDRVAACRDPTDDKFLELAVNGHADLIVSGDGDLLALNPFRDIPDRHARGVRAGSSKVKAQRRRLETDCNQSGGIRISSGIGAGVMVAPGSPNFLDRPGHNIYRSP